MQIGDTVVRHDPGGKNTTFDITSKEDLKYHQDLQENGYEYEVLGRDVTDPFSDKVVIHKKDAPEPCESCSA